MKNLTQLRGRMSAGTRFTLLIFSALVVVVGAVSMLLPVQGANPAAGTINPTGPNLMWNGTATGGAADSEANCVEGVNCDTYSLTISGQPSDWVGKQVRININWLSPTTDYDMNIHQGPVTGPVIKTSGQGVTTNETAAISPTSDGVGLFTVRVIYFAATAADQYRGSVLVETPPATPPPPPPGGGIAPRYQNYIPPAGMGTSAGEPTLGVNFDTGKVMYIAGLETLRVTFDDCPSPANATWEDVSFVTTSATTLDPILFTSNLGSTTRPERTFVSQLAGKASLLAYTDNDGESWTQSQGSGINSGVDHQNLGGGPFAPPLNRDPNGPLYPHAVYYCSQDIADGNCALSVDGGQTFGPAVPTHNALQCGGLHGHIKVAPDGTAYLPNKGCGGKQGAPVSTDNGITWTLRTIPDSTAGDWDPSVGIGAHGKVYFGYSDENGHAKIATSSNRGMTWTPSIDVGAAFGIEEIAFPVVVAGDDNRAAFAYLGTPIDGANAVWHLYISSTFDGGATWITVDATPNDPVQRGTICSGGISCGNDRNLLDFMDVVIDAQGRVLVGYADGCIGGCVQGGPNSFTALATIARQSGGRRLLAAFDPTEPRVPGAPAVTATRDGAGVHLTWTEPDNGGSPITSYRVFRREANGTYPVTPLATVTRTRYDDLSANPGVTYFYKVTAVNAIGEGPNCGEVSPAVVIPVNPCLLPGAQIWVDSSDAPPNVPPTPQLDIKSLFVAEPFDPSNPGANRLVFTLNVGPAAAPQPNSELYIIWNRQNPRPEVLPDLGSDRLFVAMKVNAAGTPSFRYGELSPPNANLATDLGPADSGTYVPATGTITIVIANNKIENVMAGNSLNDLLVRTFASPRNGLPVSQASAQDFSPNGSYQLVGNFFCRPNNTPTAALTATPTSGPAPLMVNFNASGSSDQDGDTITNYTFDFGDGTQASGASPTASHTYNSAGSYRARLSVTDSRGKVSVNVAEVVITVGAVPVGLQYYPLPRPVRLLDTRANGPDCANATTPVVGGQAQTQQARIPCDNQLIPADAQAIVGNATVANNQPGAGDGFVTLYPADVARPTVSNLNYVAGQVVPNAFVVGLGANGPNNGAFNVFASSTTDVIIDVTGYYAPPAPTGLFYHALPRPVRLLDTGAGQPACDAPGTTLTANAARTQQARVTCSGVTIPQSAKAIIGNATVVNDTGGSAPPGGVSFVTLYPSGVERPNASNLNYVAGQIVPNAFTVSLGTDGAFNIFATEAINFIVDVTGYYSDQATDANGVGLFYKQLESPLRLLDTRAGQPACDAPGVPLAGGQTRTQAARVTCGQLTIPANTIAIVGNATAVNTTANATGGFVTLYPSGVQRPTVSNLNYVAGQIVPNQFTVSLGGDGAFNIYVTSETHFLVDIAGFFAP